MPQTAQLHRICAHAPKACKLQVLSSRRVRRRPAADLFSLQRVPPADVQSLMSRLRLPEPILDFHRALEKAGHLCSVQRRGAGISPCCRSAAAGAATGGAAPGGDRALRASCRPSTDARAPSAASEEARRRSARRACERVLVARLPSGAAAV